MMEFSQARALLAVAELSSFKKAGERLHLSPPAIFAQVHQMESELGEKLYERKGRGLALTPAGRVLTDYCRRLVNMHDEAVDAIRVPGEAQGGSLYVGCGPQISVTLVPYLLRSYMAQHPKVELRLRTGNDDALLQDLRANAVDVLMMNLPIDLQELTHDPLWRHELVFVVPPGDPAADRLTASELSTRPFILCEPPTVIESSIRRFFQSAGFEPLVVMQNDQAASVRELVKMGVGISLLPIWSVSEDASMGRLRIVRLADKQLFSTMVLVYRGTTSPQPSLSSFVSIARDWRSWLPRPDDVIPFSE
ncbi:MAG: LysR family transcriptional regulator [Bryobacteraceae bacterium]